MDFEYHHNEQRRVVVGEKWGKEGNDFDACLTNVFAAASHDDVNMLTDHNVIDRIDVCVPRANRFSTLGDAHGTFMIAKRTCNSKKQTQAAFKRSYN